MPLLPAVVGPEVASELLAPLLCVWRRLGCAAAASAARQARLCGCRRQAFGVGPLVVAGHAWWRRGTHFVSVGAGHPRACGWRRHRAGMGAASVFGQA